ncbi:MAG: hypothetical protein PHF24_03710 [Syntrophomonas sp.]|nr:hypothetical protein [Syntrophomonas sp.]
MQRSILIIFLISLILALSLPLTSERFENEQAFTSDNLIIIPSGHSSN